MRILVIDDNEDIRFTISEICEFAGWTPVLAANGFEGVELFKTENLTWYWWITTCPCWTAWKP